MSIRRIDRRVAIACFLILAASILFWKFRIVDPATNPKVAISNIDLYIEHTPMAEYAYEELARGRLPLWNPYQLAGQPLLAIPHVAIFYPLHLYSLVVAAAPSIEVSFLLHMWMGGFGMWLLACRLGLTALGATGAAITFMWSGWMIFNSAWPGIFAGSNWLPLTILLIDRAVDRASYAKTALIAAVTSQLLLGATEVLLHTIYIAAAFTLCRLVAMARRGAPQDAVRVGAMILGCMGVALLLAAPQLLPSIEMVGESGRGAVGMAEGEAIFGKLWPEMFMASGLSGTGVQMAHVGVLPLLAAPLVFGIRSHRFVWIFAFALALLAMFLVFGGPVYRLYYSLPLVGSLFRRPMKFLDIYTFAQALMVGLAFVRLQAMMGWSRAKIWRSPNWLLSLLAVLAASQWAITYVPAVMGYWLGCLALLVVFGALPSSRFRYGVLIALLVLHGASLCSRESRTRMRPFMQPEIYHYHDTLLDGLQAKVGHDRIHLSRRFNLVPELSSKQGMLHRLKVATDYEPLVSSRYAEFIAAINPNELPDPLQPFYGQYNLSPRSNWRLLDLMAVRFYVAQKRDPTSKYMRQNSREFRSIDRVENLEVFERRHALPRAYLVPSVRVLASRDAVMTALTDPDFDPLQQVLLEGAALRETAVVSNVLIGRATIKVDEPEQVVVKVSSKGPAYLVLSDFFASGWHAYVDEQEVEIHRANFLFRAVEIGAGDSEVRFVYQPASLQIGAVVSGFTLAGLLAISLLGRRKRAPAR